MNPDIATPSPECQGLSQSQNCVRWSRRDFLGAASAAAAALAFRPWQTMAGPFTRKDFEKLVPADKRLSADWLASLTARGQPEVYRGADLEKIGMPIGGICCGQVYLGGDGRLWHWDIFNQHIGTGAEHYATPLRPHSPFEQGFALKVQDHAGSQTRILAREHWRDISFNGEYPLARVEYSDPDCPVTVTLEAFSPFIPLDVNASSLPVIVMEFTVSNRGRSDVQATLAGWLENPVCLHSGEVRGGSRINRVVRTDGMLLLECSGEAPTESLANPRPDIPFDDFERETYDTWSSSGTAFGSGPVDLSKVPDYQGDLGAHGKRTVNTHASAPGTTVEERDSAKGTLTSQLFQIERNYINFLIGGGAHKGRTCINLLIDGKVAVTATGKNNNRMSAMSWDVRRWVGRTATLQIVDNESGGWGNIGIDDIVFSDSPRTPAGPLSAEQDFGTMALALLDSGPADFGSADSNGALPEAAFGIAASAGRAERDFLQKLIGHAGRAIKLSAGASAKISFLICWHFPNLKMDRLPPGRSYGQRFQSATAVASYVREHWVFLTSQTRLWHDTWYQSTLPYWFLDRTFLNASILATSTAYLLGNGRFYAWEGVGCCEGTCGHVWQYAHAMARLFPELERRTRQEVDFGLAMQPDGAIHFRGEFNDFPAIDAQAGTVLRALREHQMCSDDAFLRRNWPQIRKATEWLIAKDADGNGLIESNQHNTLDTDWFGPVAWLSGLYLAALAAAQTMALEVGDQAFAAHCGSILEKGKTNIVSQLFNGDYFVNKPDPKHLDAINSGTGCEIDQVFGQSWAWQVGLERVFPKNESLAALNSLWRYNFTPDVGPYRKAYQAGRWYAMPGEAGLLMCTFPRSDWDYAQARGKGADWAAGYFNECMNGFEYQVAGHMLWEEMITEGLAITRAIHDRYHPSRRNPWNEVECGDHYARSMASHGVYLAACGFEYHGPKGHIGFAPRIHANNFQAAFTAAKGWGTFRQQHGAGGKGFRAEIALSFGELALRTLALAPPRAPRQRTVTAKVGKAIVKTKFEMHERRLLITFADTIQLKPGSKLEVRVT